MVPGTVWNHWNHCRFCNFDQRPTRSVRRANVANDSPLTQGIQGSVKRRLRHSRDGEKLAEREAFGSNGVPNQLSELTFCLGEIEVGSTVFWNHRDARVTDRDKLERERVDRFTSTGVVCDLR